jgi:hypothetical protein
MSEGVKKKRKTETYLDHAKEALRCEKYENVVGLLKKSIGSDKDNKDRGYACWMLAKAYKSGLWGTKYSLANEHDTLTKGVNFGDLLSMAEIVRIRYESSGRLAETDETILLSKQIMQSGNEHAKARLCVIHGRVSDALSHIKKADKEDMYVKISLYDLLQITESDSQYILLKESAEQGNCAAQWTLAKRLSLKKYERFKWLKKATLQGFLTKGYWDFQKFDYGVYKRLNHCINAVLCLLCIKKYHRNNCGLLSMVPFDIVKQIAKHIHKTRTDIKWEINTLEWQKIDKILLLK